MEEDKLKYKEILCKTMKSFINICKEHNLQYYACAGTCLGAIRHKGMIPWDDDIDICTSATPDIIKKQYEIIIDNSKYGSLQIKKNNYYFEITTFRIELEYHGRYPKIKYTNDILEDLNRRDFTINTFCIDQYGQIHDFLNAESDLKNGIIRCIGDTEVKIKEDPIRILRAIRFSTKLNFKIE